MAKLSPIASKFDADEGAETCRLWFVDTVESSLAASKLSIPHSTVMAELDAIIDQAETQSIPT